MQHPIVNDARGRTEKLTITTHSIAFLNKELAAGTAWLPQNSGS